MNPAHIAARLLEDDDLDPKDYTLSKLDPEVQVREAGEVLLKRGWKKQKQKVTRYGHKRFGKTVGAERRYSLLIYFALGRLCVDGWGEELVHGSYGGLDWSEWRTIDDMPDFTREPEESIEQFIDRVIDETITSKVSDEQRQGIEDYWRERYMSAGHGEDYRDA